MTIGRPSAAILALLIPLSCGGTVEQSPNNGASGSGAAGTSGSANGGAGQGGAAGKGGVGGAGGGSAGGVFGGAAGVGGTVVDAGPDVAVACGRTAARFNMEVKVYDGRAFGCGMGKDTGELELKGRLQITGPNSFTLDSCPPNMDCMPMYTDVSLPDSSLFLPSGGYVTLKLEVQQPWGCYQRLLLRNLPNWGGVPNPLDQSEVMYFAAADGTYETFAEAPFWIDRIALNCYPGSGSCGGDSTDDYVLKFGETADPSNTKVVPMGKTIGWEALPAPAGQYWRVSNLRSYSSGACDDYWNWAYRLELGGIK